VLPRCNASAPGAAVAYCVNGARVDIDSDIGEGDVVLLLAQIDDDLAAVQRDFAWTLRGTPRIDVYATRERYVGGLVGVFGYSRATAEYVADNSVAFFEPALTRIAVLWDAVKDRRPIAAIRHELTHVVTLQACAPRCDLVPAWLNEGQARLAEALIPGAEGGTASYLLYGFPGEAHVTLRVYGRHVDDTEDVAMSPQGAYFASLDDSSPPGTYTISATLGTTTVAVSVTKRGGRTPQVRPDQGVGD